MASRNLALSMGLLLIAAGAAMASPSDTARVPPKGGIYPDVIQHPVPTDLSAFKQPASLVADLKAIQTGTLQQRLEALKAKVLRDQVFVKGGTFLMGDFGPLQSKEHLPWDNNSNSSPLHKVTLTSYSISKYLVTKAEADLFSEANKKDAFGSKELRRNPSTSTPAYGTWDQANAYCKWVGTLLNVTSDLPTEAQWEYAARDRGRFIVYPTDDGKIAYNKNVSTLDLSLDLMDKKLYGIANFPATPLGLYDMVRFPEWAHDWYSAGYYEHSSIADPTGPNAGTKKVQRSSSGATYSMTMHRRPDDPTKGQATFRCVINSPHPLH